MSVTPDGRVHAEAAAQQPCAHHYWLTKGSYASVGLVDLQPHGAASVMADHDTQTF
jgi:N-acetylglucosamine-6-phosphate deacetylase